MIPQAVYILFGACLMVGTAWAMGGLLFQRLRLRLHRGEHHLLAFVTGAACLSGTVFLLSATGLARKGVFLVLGAAVIALAWRRGVHREARETLPALPRLWKVLFGLVFAAFGVLYLANAMAPEYSPDGSAYHLRFVADYARAHGFVRITTNMYANLSQGLELLMLFAFVFGRHSAGAMAHAAFLAALPLLMLCYGRRKKAPVAGAAAALFTFAAPVVGIDGVSAYNDVATACVLFALFYLLEIWDEERQPAWLIPIGMMAGFGYAIKYTAFVGVPFALGWVAWRSFRARQGVVKPVVVVAAGAAVMMLPWMVKNWVWIGNPFSPFFNALFPNPYVHIFFEKQYAYFMRHYAGINSYRDLPLALTVKGDVLCGFFGPLFLLAPLAVVAMRWQVGRRLLLATLVFGSTYAANIGARFLIPCIPFLSLALALAATSVPGAAMVLVVAHSLLSWPDVSKKYCGQYAWRLHRIDWKPALRLEKEEVFLPRVNPAYSLARMVEEGAPPGSRVLSFNAVAEAYTTREVLVVYQAAFNEAVGDILWTPLAKEFPPNWHHTFRFSAQPLRKVRVVQTAGGKPDQWSVGELHVFGASGELPRAPEWRLRAEPNPWDVQMAFDNSPVTRWRSWQSLYPGMFLEVDFGRQETVSAVRAECSRDQYGIRLKVEGMDAGGHWKTLSEAPQQSNAAPRPGLRHAATEELKARGVTHLLVWDSDFAGDDLRVNARAWGLTPVRELGPVRLYQLN